MSTETQEVWWVCTRCRRSVHNHSSEGVKELNPRVCSAEVAPPGGKRQGCRFIRDKRKR